MHFFNVKSTPISNIGATDDSVDEYFKDSDEVMRETTALHKSRSDETLSQGLRAELYHSRQPRLSTIAASPQHAGNFRRARSDSKNDANWTQFLASMCSKHPELEQEIKKATTKEDSDDSEPQQGEEDDDDDEEEEDSPNVQKRVLNTITAV